MSNDDEIARLTTDPSLKDHQRHGKRLIAPWNQGRLNLRESDWKLHRLPELIWIAELMAEIGVDRTQAIVTTVIESAQQSNRIGEPILPLFASFWHHSSGEAIKAVRDGIRSKNLASDLTIGLQGFHCIHTDYPACRLLGRARIKSCRTSYIVEFTRRLIPLLSRFSCTSVALHALITRSLIATGTLVFPNGMPPLKFDLAFETEVDQKHPEYELLAGFVRSTVNSFFAAVADELESVAPKLFWQRNLSLGPCAEFPSEYQQ